MHLDRVRVVENRLQQLRTARTGLQETIDMLQKITPAK